MSAEKHLTLRERIRDELVRMIVSGELPAGAAIDEKKLVDSRRRRYAAAAAC